MTPTNPVRTGEPRSASVFMWAVLGASFGLSANTWIALAELAGFTGKATIPNIGITLAMSWLMPIAVDGYVVVALVLWMAPVPAKVAAFAKKNTYFAAGTGIIAQSAYHLLSTWAATSEIWRVVLAAIVGALPPTVAGLAVHMRALIRRESSQANNYPPASPAPAATPTHPVPTTVPVPTTTAVAPVPPVDTPPGAVSATPHIAASTTDIPPAVPAPKPDTVPTYVPQGAPIPTPATVAARITPAPATAPRPRPAPTGTAPRNPQPRTNTPNTPAQPLPASSTDSPVKATEPVQPPLPLVPPDVLERATEIARAYRAENGSRITAGRLAVKLQVNSKQANEILGVIDDTPNPVHNVNGTPVKATR